MTTLAAKDGRFWRLISLIEDVKKVLLCGKNFDQPLKNLDPSSIKSVMKTKGIQIAESLSQSPDAVICVDYSKRSFGTVLEARKLGIKTVLIMNEPSVVIPQHSQTRILKHFDSVVRVGRPDKKGNFLPWPQTWRPLGPIRDRLSRVVLINADKWSFVAGNHYWLRAAIGASASKVDFFGPGWARSQWVRLAHRVYEFLRTLFSGTCPVLKGSHYVLARPMNYLGEVEDKVATMSKYKVALVIENSSELITEKLFDAWFAGCIPVYVGPEVSDFDLPNNLILRSDGDLPSVRESIEIALSMDHSKFLIELEKFMTSDRALEWASEKAMISTLREALGT